MFSKKCPHCGEKSSKKFSFCPYCGKKFGSEEEERDFGLLGKNDFLGIEKEIPFFARFPFKKLVEKLSKDIEKQIGEIDRELGREKPEKTRGINIQIRMSGPLKNIELGNMERLPELRTEKIKNTKMPKISKAKQEHYASLPREEAETKVRRLSNKIIYEINLPGVEDMKDIFVNKLENSIEIKAFSEDKAYFKILPINLPVKNYKLQDEILVLELAG